MADPKSLLETVEEAMKANTELTKMKIESKLMKAAIDTKDLVILNFVAKFVKDGKESTL